MARVRQKRRPGLPLPWEQRTAILRELLSGPRWKVALLLVALAGGVGLTWRAADSHSRYRQTRAAIADVHRSVQSFRADVGRCPRTPDELVHPPQTGARYLRELPTDGWGRPLYVRCPAPHDPDGAEVVSAGASGSFFVDDNVR